MKTKQDLRRQTVAVETLEKESERLQGELKAVQGKLATW